LKVAGRVFAFLVDWVGVDSCEYEQRTIQE
jgi:hypothetical protein